MSRKILTTIIVIVALLVGAITFLLVFQDPDFEDNFPLETADENVIYSFDIPIFYSKNVPLREATHVKSVLDEYLDNNEDGEIDNSLVLETLLSQNAALIVVSDEKELEQLEDQYSDYSLQLITRGDINTLGSRKNEFDPTIEEVWHLITTYGYSIAYPDAFAENKESMIANAMDISRGGYFGEIPDQYPNDAVYTYMDQTCEYNCQISEYFYWGLTSLLGGQNQPGRYEEIQDEWKLNTPDKVRDQAQEFYKLLIDPQYLFPTHIPDGDYQVNEY